ncbi:uncharacterized protein LOC103496198 isoform X2 [Cucumis melo]|uniref:Uncharacterized protein LOC103496198 isoform X2 n=1 Tax=Cucumis melo TaxID=3656 RepID=A0ABM3KV59_CUCME|nr:uncharacterized protein LOC103496198 isoform X2 [Cucumis melo]
MQANAVSDCDISEDDEFDSIEEVSEGKEELQLNLRPERLKGIRGKAKPKFMFHSQRKEQSCSVICEDRLCSASISKVHSLSETFDAITSRTDKYPTECLEDLVEEFDDQFDVGPALNCGNTESSISELLDGLKDKNSSLGGVTNGVANLGGECSQLLRTGLLLHNRYRTDSEDSPISVDDESASDHEVNDQKLKLAGLCTKEQSITDRFEEALVAACMDAERTIGVPNPLGIGLFGKLQRVMQSEKELEINFLNGVDCSTIPNGCIDVKILSRYLDAKLTVCSCLFIDMEQYGETKRHLAVVSVAYPVC